MSASRAASFPNGDVTRNLFQSGRKAWILVILNRPVQQFFVMRPISAGLDGILGRSAADRWKDIMIEVRRVLYPGVLLILMGWMLAPGLPMAAAETPVAPGNSMAEGFATVKSADLAAMLRKKDFWFVNVHIPYEGEIAGTDASIPFDEIRVNLEMLPADKTAKIVLYCLSGRMSEAAARDLVQLGYTQVAHLSGGMNDWERSGYRLISR